MDVPMLILLGAAGGALRGALDAYNRFLDWQLDRRVHRQLPAGHEAAPPQFRDYFDPVADPVAAVVHSAMGAGAAVLFGTTGQVSGAYAAVVVGISAPVILAQLGRVQPISDAVSGTVSNAPQTVPAREEQAAQEVPPAAPPAQQPASARAQPLPPMAQPPASSPAQPEPTLHGACANIDDLPRTDIVPGLRSDIDTGNRQPNHQPAGPAGGSGGVANDRGARHRQHGPAIGEEGTTR
jgi:hypothetical protein